MVQAIIKVRILNVLTNVLTPFFSAEASISDYKEGSLPPPINWSTRPRATLFSSAEASICDKKEGSLPPPINWSTHPRATPPPSAEASIFDNKEGSLPPPINWSTHPRARSLPSTPKKSQLEYGGLSSQHGGTPLQTWVDPHFAIERPRGNGFQLDLYGHCFDAGVSFSAVPEPAPNINNSTLPEVPSQPDTSTQSTIVSGQDYPSPPGHPKYHFVASASSSAYTKYYIVVVGKCAGVFTFW
jgi:hypothetical protein